jgi:hypothetical protein
MEGLNVGSMKVAKSGVIHGPIKHHLPLLHKTKSKTLRFTYLLSASPNYSPTACSVGLVLNETDLKHSRLNKVGTRQGLSEGGGGGEYLQSGHCAVSGIPSRALPHTCLLRYRYTICRVRTLSLFSKAPHSTMKPGTWDPST